MENNNAPYGRIHVRYDSSSPNSSGGEFVPVSKKMSRHEKLTLLLTSGILGLCVLFFHYVGTWLVDLMASSSTIMRYYSTSDAAFNIVQIVYSFVCILLPFAVASFFLGRIHKDREIVPLGKPNSGRLVLLSLGIGFLALVISNYITTFFVLGADSVGVYFESGTSPTPETTGDFLWQVLSTAMVPALVEEFAVRGVVMQSLRKYGDIFAIATSSVIFALLHGNMVQAPFALLLGAVLGWLVIATDSLWTGIAIHFMNNFYATCMNAMSANTEEIVYIAVFLIINFIGVAVGIFCLVRAVSRHRQKFRLSEPGGNTSGARRRYRLQAFFYTIISLPMLAAFVVLIKDIVSRVHFIG